MCHTDGLPRRGQYGRSTGNLWSRSPFRANFPDDPEVKYGAARLSVLPNPEVCIRRISKYRTSRWCEETYLIDLRTTHTVIATTRVEAGRVDLSPLPLITERRLRLEGANRKLDLS